VDVVGEAVEQSPGQAFAAQDLGPFAEGRIRFPAKAVLTYSPATKAHAGLGGMTLAEICEGAVALSDNTAANLMLDALDGPAGLTAWLRSAGDDVTRLDRTEPTLNEALLDDPRDTTSPLRNGGDPEPPCPGQDPADRQWAAVRDLLPGKVGDRGRSGANNRAFVNGVLWVLRSGARWSDLPPRYGGNWKTAHKRFTRWAHGGAWERVFRHLSRAPDNEYPQRYRLDLTDGVGMAGI
jgi:transposase